MRQKEAKITSPSFKYNFVSKFCDKLLMCCCCACPNGLNVLELLRAVFSPVSQEPLFFYLLFLLVGIVGDRGVSVGERSNRLLKK